MDYFIGIDVSKYTLDVEALREGEPIVQQKIENQAKSINLFLNDFLKTNHLTSDQLVVCMEYTGIYNAVALEVFWKRGVKICLERALHIKQSQGMMRGKNDRIDAHRIASFAYKNRSEIKFWTPARKIVQQLKVLLSVRERLLRIKVQLEVPVREAVGFIEPSVLKQMNLISRKPLAAIKKEIKETDKKLEALIGQDSIVREKMKQVTSVPGIGKITAMNMMVTTTEFTRITDSKKFACYAGVAPFEHSSGTSIRGRNRVSKMANMNMKTLLHLAAMSAIQCDPELKSYYHRKVDAGKNKMTVINAVRNKLINRVFACVNNNRCFEKNYQHALA